MFRYSLLKWRLYAYFEDTKGVVRHQSSKDRQNNDQMKKFKMTYNCWQNTTENQRSTNTNPTKIRTEII